MILQLPTHTPTISPQDIRIKISIPDNEVRSAVSDRLNVIAYR